MTDDDDDDVDEDFLSSIKYSETARICSLLFFFHIEVLSEKIICIFIGNVADMRREILKLGSK